MHDYISMTSVVEENGRQCMPCTTNFSMSFKYDFLNIYFRFFQANIFSHVIQFTMLYVIQTYLYSFMLTGCEIMKCFSSNGKKYVECDIEPNIVTVTIKKLVSTNAGCRFHGGPPLKNYNTKNDGVWGLTHDFIWVAGGCKAFFKMCSNGKCLF